MRVWLTVRPNGARRIGPHRALAEILGGPRFWLTAGLGSGDLSLGTNESRQAVIVQADLLKRERIGEPELYSSHPNAGGNRRRSRQTSKRCDCSNPNVMPRVIADLTILLSSG